MAFSLYLLVSMVFYQTGDRGSSMENLQLMKKVQHGVQHAVQHDDTVKYPEE